MDSLVMLTSSLFIAAHTIFQAISEVHEDIPTFVTFAWYNPHRVDNGEEEPC